MAVRARVLIQFDPLGGEEKYVMITQEFIPGVGFTDKSKVSSDEFSMVQGALGIQLSADFPENQAPPG